MQCMHHNTAHLDCDMRASHVGYVSTEQDSGWECTMVDARSQCPRTGFQYDEPSIKTSNGYIQLIPRASGAITVWCHMRPFDGQQGSTDTRLG